MPKTIKNAPTKLNAPEEWINTIDNRDADANNIKPNII